MRRLSLLALVAFLFATAPPARAADAVIVSTLFRFVPGDDCLGRTADGCYSPPTPLVVEEGASVWYANLEVAIPHGVRSFARHATYPYRPLFDSGLHDTGGNAEVVGVRDLPPGTYGFYCPAHEAMTGTLIVT